MPVLEGSLRDALAIRCKMLAGKSTPPEVVANLALCRRTPEQAKDWARRNVVMDWAPESEFDMIATCHDPEPGPKLTECCGYRMDSDWDYCPHCGNELDGEDIPFDRLLSEEKAKAKGAYLERVNAAIDGAVASREVA